MRIGTRLAVARATQGVEQSPEISVIENRGEHTPLARIVLRATQRISNDNSRD
jgi:hypothetical protein